MPGRLSRRLIPSVMALPPATTSSSSIARRFEALRKKSRTALVCYVTAGHPDVERWLATLTALQGGGADIIELGVPFSDPIADGPVIEANDLPVAVKRTTYEGRLSLVERAHCTL